MRTRRFPAMAWLLRCAMIWTIACENTAPPARRVPALDDYVVAEGSDSVALATVDTYRLRAHKVPTCAPLPEPPAGWVVHRLPGARGATLRVPPELVESIDTMPDSSITSGFKGNKAFIHIMFSPHGDNSPGTLPTGCGTRIAGFETPLYMSQRQQTGRADSVFEAQVTFALPDTMGVFIALSARTRDTRDSLLAVFRSFTIAQRRASAH